MKHTQILSLALLGSFSLVSACNPPPARPTIVNMGSGDLEGANPEHDPYGDDEQVETGEEPSDTSGDSMTDPTGTDNPKQEEPKKDEPVKEEPKKEEEKPKEEKPKEEEKPKDPEPTIRELFTEQQFNQMLPNKIPFYTYEGFMQAAEAVGGFAKEGTVEVRKREIAAILANARHESDEFRAVNEYNMAAWPGYCMASAQYPCAAGKTYHGRGPIQLSWNYNYKDAGTDLGLDLVNNPDLVANDPKVAFQTMMWFWMKRGKDGLTCHQAITQGKGFGATINIINGGLECPAGRGQDKVEQVNKRISNYKQILQTFGLQPLAGEKLDCL